jgi:putative protein-disulfide isomerase
MCSWCWAFNPVREKLFGSLPEQVAIEFVLGGLAPDTDQPMPEQQQRRIQQIWRTIEAEVPGTRFNFDFWKDCHPRRATYAACRAVISAARQAPDLGKEMILAIQRAYYCEAKNPSDIPVLVDLAGSLGLDRKRFAEDLEAPDTIAELARQIAFARKMGVSGFPTLVFQNRGCGHRLLAIDYHDSEVMLEQIHAALKHGK